MAARKEDESALKVHLFHQNMSIVCNEDALACWRRFRIQMVNTDFVDFSAFFTFLLDSSWYSTIIDVEVQLWAMNKLPSWNIFMYITIFLVIKSMEYLAGLTPDYFKHTKFLQTI